MGAVVAGALKLAVADAEVSPAMTCKDAVIGPVAAAGPVTETLIVHVSPAAIGASVHGSVTVHEEPAEASCTATLPICSESLPAARTVTRHSALPST